MASMKFIYRITHESEEHTMGEILVKKSGTDFTAYVTEKEAARETKLLSLPNNGQFILLQ
jgi:hypothetical protein